MFPYVYHVDWYDWDEEKKESPIVSSSGLVFAANYPDAVHRICEFFGEENIAKFSIQIIVEGLENIRELTDEQVKYFETNFS